MVAKLVRLNKLTTKSGGLENVAKGMALINELYGKNYEITLSDADAGAGDVGTMVRVPIG